ncbi:hypothetical protein IMSHALPRED_007092 [Imshaugia aleurites]|uniref:Uncharacterized protein n=1 Tax=Imshaugia aleurites TaxID=172621 RepID=A0A8H3FLW0_9LECA|nr:hypothetical protein IMSHALPRED_007092 [Imshaugia aleurites]
MHFVKGMIVVALATPLVTAGPRGHALRRRTGDDDKDSSSSSLLTKDLTPSSSASAKDQPTSTLVGTAPVGTGISSAPEITQAVVVTDVVYTTLTTCPVTSLVSSGSTSFEEITTTISTVTRTSTSTLCTKCVAPPSKPALSSSSPNTVPVVPPQTAISSKPEVLGTAASPSRSLIFPNFVSLAVSATSGTSSTLRFPGFGIVPSPTSPPGSPREEVFSNATSSIIPVYTAALLGNAYGGGFIGTPSVYVTKLPYPNGPASGVPPGYGSESSISIIENNVTAVLIGLGASSISAAGLESTTSIGVSAITATIASNVSVLVGSLGTSNISATSSMNGGTTPTFISLSPFGGEVGQEFSSTAVPTLQSTEVPSSVGFTIVGIGGSATLSATGSDQTGNAESSGANVITALVAATSPAGALSAEVNQVSNAVLPLLSAAGLSISAVNVQVAVVGSSTTSIVSASGETAESSFPTSTLIEAAAILPTVATVSPLGAGSSNFQAIQTAENAGSSNTSANGFRGVIEASAIPATTVAGSGLSPTFSSSGVNIEATPTGSATPGEIGATVIPSLPAEQSAGPVVTLAVGSSAEQAPAAGQPTASVPTPILLANGSTALAVVPSPVVGANGLTSLAVFSTPIVPAAGLTTPAVLLTPIVGANGLTSLAVVATPVVGANGLTSLAIGFETSTIPSAGQSNSAPTPIEGFAVVQPSALTPQVSGLISTPANLVVSGVANVGLPSVSTQSPASGGNGNFSIHVLLSPTAATEFHGSAVRLSLGFGVGLFALMVFFVLL